MQFAWRNGTEVERLSSPFEENTRKTKEEEEEEGQKEDEQG